MMVLSVLLMMTMMMWVSNYFAVVVLVVLVAVAVAVVAVAVDQ